MSILNAVEAKLDCGESLARDEAIALWACDDLPGLGRLADRAKRQRWGDRAHFVLNRQINPSNICVLSCRFCDFATKRGRSDAYELTIEDILACCNGGIREVHVVGSLHPDWPFNHYVEMLRAIRARVPHVHIKAFTAVEIEYFAKKARLTIDDVLRQLKAAGLDMLPGGGAEVFSERVRRQLFPFKMGFPRWAAIHQAAHRLGIPTNATLLYGHIETVEERVDHLLLLREVQAESLRQYATGFMSFIPLAYQVGPKSRVVVRQASPIDGLKMLAVSRLVLENVPHIKAYWVTLGEVTASIGLHFGADDIDGTIGEERIMHAADAASPVRLTRDRLVRLIRDAGLVPVERDACYGVIEVHDGADTLAVAACVGRPSCDGRIIGV